MVYNIIRKKKDIKGEKKNYRKMVWCCNCAAFFPIFLLYLEYI